MDGLRRLIESSQDQLVRVPFVALRARAFFVPTPRVSLFGVGYTSSPHEKRLEEDYGEA